ncbi:MAG TPA: AzlD domain-containing protein [Steroidobacteraceae bacterium]|nr:AzlD domain-containing protein [Steroidobacteraceae bacterium]
MSELSLDTVIVGLALVTLVTRSLFLAIGERVSLPARVQHGLRYAPVCALVALVVPQLVLTGPALQLSLANPRLVAALVAAWVMHASRSMLAAMGAGMATLVVLRLLI